jgi:GMP reductase
MIELIKIKKSKIIKNRKRTFDLEVEKDHSYNINGVIVHNSSAVCRTRTQTGVGRPQFSTVLDCADVAKKYGGMICSDGGVQKPADYVKAIAAYSDFVMMGGYLAGYSQSGGDLITKLVKTGEVDKNGKEIIEERKYKLFYGMSSAYAQNQHYDGLPFYRASEGTVFEVPYKGDVSSAIQNLEGGLRSAMTYTGAKTLEEFPNRVDFYRVRHQLNRMFGDKERE